MAHIMCAAATAAAALNQAGRPKVHIQLQQLCDASQVPSSWLQLQASTLLRILGMLDTKQLARCARHGVLPPPVGPSALWQWQL